MAEVCNSFELGPDACAMFCKHCGHPKTAHVEREGLLAEARRPTPTLNVDWDNLPYDRIDGGALEYGRRTPMIGRFEVLFSPAFLGGMGEDNE